MRRAVLLAVAALSCTIAVAEPPPPLPEAPPTIAGPAGEDHPQWNQYQQSLVFYQLVKQQMVAAIQAGTLVDPAKTRCIDHLTQATAHLQSASGLIDDGSEDYNLIDQLLTQADWETQQAAAWIT